MNRLQSSLKNPLTMTILNTIKSSTAGFKTVSHCIFDMDGLLLDTETLYTLVTQNILDEYSPGKIYTWELKVTLMGLQKEDVSKKIVEIFDLPITWEEYAELAQAQIEDLMKNCRLMPDTEKIYEKAVENIAKKYNRPYPWDVRMKILGTIERRTCEIAVKELKLPCTVDDFQRQFVQITLKNLENVYLFKGAERLVRHLHENNVPICLATSSSKESVEVKTTHHKELFNLFHHKVMGSSDPEVKEGKPAPDIFLVAAKRFPDSPKPDDVCLVFEDAPNGCKAARSAGMQVVMVPDSHVSENQKQDATVVYKSLLDFKPEDFGLPPYKDN
ncbi:CLUMA_CG018983, isoform A [Clunio marinus]|uniref:CLUMA_CG018983, isoform A n=1 Tax=Clunio marinus TaxID=568069 RepID=A0A1J1J559_9DIPT|nr:CLUMA_CG018983, isoform A [Clunio marinus]